MRIYEITSSQLRSIPKTKTPIKRRASIKGPYAPAPKPLPKPRPLYPSNINSKNIKPKSHHRHGNSGGKSSPIASASVFTTKTAMPITPSNFWTPMNQNSHDHEKEEFLKQVRGESPRKPL